MQPTDIDIKFCNHSNFVYHSNKSPIFRDRLIPTINKSYLPKFKSSYTLKMLSTNSGSKAVCDQIYLILPLNQLQHLTVEGILDHSIKNKGKMFLDLDQQLLVYIRDEGGIEKSRVVNVIQMGFSLLGRKKS